MRTLVPLVVAVAAFLAATASACGDETVLKLPTAGAWARYHAITTKDSNEESVGTMFLKSLTATKIDGMACRWMESEFLSGEEKFHERRKFLIPEEAILSSEKPCDDILRYLQRDGESAVASVPPENQGWMPMEFLYFPGFLKGAKVIDDPRTVQHQTGKFEIQKAYVGTYRWWRKGRVPEKSTVWETQYHVWLHSDLPVGFAHAQAKLILFSEGKEVRSWRLDYALQEFGNSAQHAITEESAPPIGP